MEYVRWVQQKEPFAVIPGDEALLKVEVARSCEIVGYVSHLAWNCEEAGRPFLHAVAVRSGEFRAWRLAEPGGWEGRFALLAPDSAPVRPGDVLEWARDGRVRRGAPSDMPFAGICQTTAGPEAFVVAATSGPALSVRCPSEQANTWLVKGPDGTAVAAGAKPGQQQVGWSYYVQDGQATVDVGTIRG